MSVVFENKDRKVIPNFRSLKKTIRLGELNSQNSLAVDFQKDDLSDYIEDFKNNNSLAHAGDLISAAIVNNEIDNSVVREAAMHIIDNKKSSTSPQLAVASKILYIELPSKAKVKIYNIEDFLEKNSSYLIRDRIKRLKNYVLNFKYNPFVYAELARLYSIIGQAKSAKKNLLIAKGLAPNNRYILRSFARLMSHYNDVEQAHDALKRSPATKSDPWLLASEIAFASLRNKNSNFIKNGLNLIASNKLMPFSISELASSIGTVEMINGSRKKSITLFEKALICPNDNSLAQVEWANNKADFFDLDLNKFSVQNISEAETLASFNSGNYEEAIRNAEHWFIDMPFAKRPVMFATQASGFFLEDYETAIKFCKAGLVSNPLDPNIINNLAYYLALNNDSTSAFNYLNKIDINTVHDDKIRLCLLATKGLTYYRNGQPEKGREYYMKAAVEAMDKKLKYYYAMALMHLTREEINLGSEESIELIERVRKIDIKGEDKALEVMKERVLIQKEKPSVVVNGKIST